MSAFALLLLIVLFVILIEDAEREHREFIESMDACFDRIEAKIGLP